MKICLQIMRCSAISARAIWGLYTVFLAVWATGIMACAGQISRARGVSTSIDDSKKRGVFVQEYVPSKSKWVVNDSTYFIVGEAWLEARWEYAPSGQLYRLSGYQLCVNTKAQYLNDYDVTWDIGVDGDRYFYRTVSDPLGNVGLVCRFDSIPTSKVEEWKIQRGNDLMSKANKDIVATFSLYRVAQ